MEASRLPRRWQAAVASCYIRALAETSESGRLERVPEFDGSAPPEKLRREIIDILKYISRLPIEPTENHELLGDLGFDSLQVLELVGELEERFNVTVPLGNLAHIRTVGQVVAEVQRLSGSSERPA